MILENYNIIDVKKTFEGEVSWVIKMDIREVPLVISEIIDKTSGRVIFTIVEEL